MPAARIVPFVAAALLLPAMASGRTHIQLSFWAMTVVPESIVVAEWIEAEQRVVGADDEVSRLTTLRVLDTLKGPVTATVTVEGASRLYCPGPVEGPESRVMIAFLARDGERWYPLPFADQPLCPLVGEREEVVELLRRAVELQAASNDPEIRSRPDLDWLVRAAALPTTRERVLADLAPPVAAGDSEASESSSRGFPITPHHQALLAAAFVEAPRADDTMAPMLQLLHGHADPAVDHLARASLESQLALESPAPFTQELLRALLARAGDAEADSRLGEEPWKASPERLRKAWSDARERYGLRGPPEEVGVPE